MPAQLARCARDTGPRSLPLKRCARNQVRCEIVAPARGPPARARARLTAPVGAERRRSRRVLWYRREPRDEWCSPAAPGR